MTDYQIIKAMLEKKCDPSSGGYVKAQPRMVTTTAKWVNGEKVESSTEHKRPSIEYLGHGMDTHSTIFHFDDNENFDYVSAGGLRY